MKAYITTFFLCVFSQFVFAFENTGWHNGFIVLDSDQIIKGSINYDYITEVIQYQSQEKVKVYPANQVKFFKFYDGAIKRYRKFISKNFNPRYRYQRKTFIEILIEGELNLMQQKKKNTEEVDHYLCNSKKIIKINKSGQNILMAIRHNHKEINEFIKKRKLNLGELKSQVLLIHYYNYLTDKDYFKKLSNKLVLDNQYITGFEGIISHYPNR